MSRKRAKARRQQKHTTKLQQKRIDSPKSLWGRIFSWIWKLFAGFAVLLGVYGALHPKISVSSSTYLDPSAPLKALFNVTNDGLMTLHNVQPSCAIRHVVLDSGQEITGVEDYRSLLFNPAHFSKKLAPGETDTVFCPLGALKLPTPVDSADIAIVVDYSFMGIHWPRKIYPFTTSYHKI